MLSNEIIKDTYKVKSTGKNELILQDPNGKEKVVQTGEDLAVADNRLKGRSRMMVDQQSKENYRTI